MARTCSQSSGRIAVTTRSTRTPPVPRREGDLPAALGCRYVFLYSDLSILYSAIFVVMLRRDSPQILAQRLTLPRAFFSALRMYCCSSCAEDSRSSSSSGFDRSTWNGPDEVDADGATSSGGRVSTWISSPREVTHVRSMAFSNSRTLPGQR